MTPNQNASRNTMSVNGISESPLPRLKRFLGSLAALATAGSRMPVRAGGASRTVLASMSLFAVLLAALWASPVSAYPTYSCDGTGDDPDLCFDGADGTNPDSGNCAQCHGGFRQGGYVSLTADDPAAWGNELMNGHVNAYGLACADCHTGNGQPRTPTFLDAADGGITCSNCHGRDEDITANDGAFGGPEPGRSDGLRAHHASAGITVCADCHTADTTPVGEHVPSAAFVIKGIDPCDENGAAAGTGRIGNVGLDQDGDLAREPDDLDCLDPPDIAVNPLSLDFGVVAVGTTLTLTTTISNVGGAELTVTSLTPTGSIDFSLNPAAPLPPFAIAPGGSVNVPVDYTPAEDGADSGTLEILSNDPDEPAVSVSLAGTGQVFGGDCVVSVNPLSLDFGQVLQGDTATLTATITNNSADTDCNVSALTFTGSADFALNPGAPATPFAVPPLGSLDVPVDYTPSDAGQDSGTLDIASDDPVNPLVSVSLAGEGIAAVCDIDVNPLALDFGPVNVGETATLSTTIANTGTVDCTVSALTLSGSPDFTLNPGAPATPFTVAPAATVEVPVDYTPSDANPDNGTLDIASDDADENPVSVALQGTGSTQLCTVSPLTLDYGNVELGATATLSTTVSNPAGAPARCAVNSITFDNPEFSLSTSSPSIPPFNVWPGQSRDVWVDYTPVDLGTDNNTMTLNIRDSDGATVFDALVGLTGTGVPPTGPADIDVNPLALDFGTVNIGVTETLTTTISNLGGSDLTVTGLSLTGSPDFSVNPGAPVPPFTVAPGASVEVPVDYMPFEEGADNGMLDIASDDPDENPVSVSLSGTGQLPPLGCDIDVNPLSLDFGSVEVGTTATLSTAIGNTGSADCAVNSLTLSGSTDFALNPVAPVPPFAVGPGGSVNVLVDYTPSDAGGDAGALAIGSNDPDENPVSVSLTGSGIPPGEVDLDIQQFRVRPKNVRLPNPKPVRPTLTVANSKSTDGTAPATVVGVQNGGEVYRQTLNVSVSGGGVQTFEFPSYTPTAAGDIMWTATIADDDPDIDTATATTSVR